MQVKNFIIVILIVIIIPLQVKAQSKTENNLTGNLPADSKILFEKNNYTFLPELMPQSVNKKSPMLAGLLSFLIPGAGEIYAESYIKGAIFIALEAAVITTAIIYDNKGDKQTEKFENFANENWSVERYARWTIDNVQNPESIIYDPNFNPEDYSVFNANGTVNWGELNRLEGSIKLGYSHHLPPFGDQQYYELIGKYPQYSHGWSDANQGETDYHILSPYFLYYSGERGEANDLYNIASTAVIAIYVNHFLSVLDAVWTTSQYNNQIALKMRMEKIQRADKVELVPTLNFSFRF